VYCTQRQTDRQADGERVVASLSVGGLGFLLADGHMVLFPEGRDESQVHPRRGFMQMQYE